VDLAAKSKLPTANATKTEAHILRLLLAAVLMAIAANCFLKYLWWTACYSAWSGIPKLADQWKAAGSRASSNGWSSILLELAGVIVLFSMMRPRHTNAPQFFRNGLRLVLSLAIAIAGTAIFALALSWFKQGTH
jgi:hypothetical protein